MRGMKGAGAAAEREGRTGEGAAGGLAGAVSWPKRAKTFLQDVRSETRRVTWPSMKQIRATTVVVIITVFFFGAYFGILDWIYTRAVGWLLQWGQ